MLVALKNVINSNISGFGINKKLCKLLSKNNVSKFQRATIKIVSNRTGDEFPNVKPFPYHEKEYSMSNFICDLHPTRLHEYSKLIVVDGPIACGKEKFAQDLAREFDFLFVPQPTFDDLYITPWGFDARTLDCKLPKDVQSWDIERFLHDPHDVNTAAMQQYMYFLRQVNYMKALLHIICTGQGVVTVRSPWSDIAFSKAMMLNKFISKPAFRAILDSYEASLIYYLRPHLFIYLDVPVEKTMENIQKHGKPFEKSSKVLNEKYLTDIDNAVKNDVYQYFHNHSIQLVYDWSKEPELDIILYDIESLTFDMNLIDDWNLKRGDERLLARRYSTNLRDDCLLAMDTYTTVPELNASAESFRIWHKVWGEVDDSKYEFGFNPLKGDKNLLFKKSKFAYTYEDHVTPLLKKYNERKLKEK